MSRSSDTASWRRGQDLICRLTWQAYVHSLSPLLPLHASLILLP